MARIKARIWWFCADFKAYCRDPTRPRRTALERRFDSIFTTSTGFATLDRLLARLHANKVELLVALDRPEIPLHTNDSENDIRCRVTRRRISGGARPDTGRQARDAMLSLMNTRGNLGGLRKIRFAAAGRDKSKSVRVVYYFYNDTMPVFMLTVFAKNKKDNLSKAERNALAKVARALRDSYGD